MWLSNRPATHSAGRPQTLGLLNCRATVGTGYETTWVAGLFDADGTVCKAIAGGGTNDQVSVGGIGCLPCCFQPVN